MPETGAVAPTGDDFDDEPKTDATAEKPAEKTFSQADLDRVVAERIARERARFSDYADLKKKAAAAMTEQERAVSEAEQRGRSAALASTGQRLAKAELKAAAAGKVSESALEGFLEYAEIGRFVGDDGEPDTKAIQAAIKKLAAGGSGSTNYDGGARSSAGRPNDMNALIRHAAGFGS